jgi:hypothetical protein
VQLTEEEKRANHVASEQKRRKNIRLGFRALTQLVPELRVHSDRYLSDKEEGDEEDGQSNVKRRRKSERASHSAPSKSDILASGKLHILVPTEIQIMLMIESFETYNIHNLDFEILIIFQSSHTLKGCSVAI